MRGEHPGDAEICVVFYCHELFLSRSHTRHGLVQVYLTSVGGGAFGNKVGWIQEAIKEMLLRFHYLVRCKRR